MAEICQFSIFQDGGRRHLGFLKLQIFNGLNGPERRTACTAAELWRFFEMAVAAILNF